MRVFKFKIWDAENKEFIHDAYNLNFALDGFLLTFKKDEPDESPCTNDEDDGPYVIEVTHYNGIYDYGDLKGLQRYNLLQYTGFKARDQEIYDGDILLDLTYPDTPMYYVVSWSQAKGTWMLQRKDKEGEPRYLTDGKVLEPMYRSFLAGGVTNNLEVVGNIHTEKSDD